LATCLLFAAFWAFLNIGRHAVLIPEDSFEWLKDESLRDIANTTLGVGDSSECSEGDDFTHGPYDVVGSSHALATHHRPEPM
jgi:hypothetical protein